MTQHFKWCLDGISLSVVVSAIAGWLPPIAALMSIIWLGMQMYDWIQKKKGKKLG